MWVEYAFIPLRVRDSTPRHTGDESGIRLLSILDPYNQVPMQFFKYYFVFDVPLRPW